MLIALDAESLLQFFSVGQVQIRAVIGQHAMPTPGQDFAVLPVELVKIVSRGVMKMDKQSRIEFLPGLTQGAVGRSQAQFSERSENFIERILEREFMTSKN